MPTCVAYGCSNRSAKKPQRQIDLEKATNRKVHFFRFPKDPIKRFLWEKAVRRSGWTPTDSSSICSVHFEDHFIDRSMVNFRLREDAIPTIFPAYPKHLQEKTRKILLRKEAQIPTNPPRLVTAEPFINTPPPAENEMCEEVEIKMEDDEDARLQVVDVDVSSFKLLHSDIKSPPLKIIPIPKEAVNSLPTMADNNSPLKIIQLPRNSVNLSQLKMECPPLRISQVSKSTMTGPDLQSPEIIKLRNALKAIKDKYQTKVKTLQQTIRRKKKTIERLTSVIESLKNREKLSVMYDED